MVVVVPPPPSMAPKARSSSAPTAATATVTATSPTAPPRDLAEEIRRAAAGQWLNALRGAGVHWPDGEMRSREYWCRSPLRADAAAGSFSINLDTGLFNDFASGDKGDGFQFLQLSTGCTFVEAARKLAEALNIPTGESKPRRPSKSSAPPAGCTLAEYAAAKGFNADLLTRVFGLRDHEYLGVTVVEMPYADAAGARVAVRYRTALTKTPTGGDDRFRWRKGAVARELVYGLEHAARAVYPPEHVAPRVLLVVEGESNVHAAAHRGMVALGVPGKSVADAPAIGRAVAAFASQPGREGLSVLILVDPDATGVFDRDVASSCRQAGFKGDILSTIPQTVTTDKDFADLHLRHHGLVEPFQADFDRLLASAKPVMTAATAEITPELARWRERPPRRTFGSIRPDACQLAESADRAWDALAQSNAQDPRLFLRGGYPVRVVRNHDGSTAVSIAEPLTKDRCLRELARALDWTRSTTTGDRPCAPPDPVVRTILATENPPLPPLSRITSAPVISRSGEITTTPGYHRATRTLYSPPAGLSVPSVPETPTAADIEKAKHLLLVELFGDFPFVSPSDRAHALALCLQPFVRDRIEGPTPIYLVESPTQGTGKGKLAKAALTAAVGDPGEAVGAEDAAEWRKKLTTEILAGTEALVIDNLDGRLDSSSLASALTASKWTDRVLGSNARVEIPIRTTWVATANNLDLSKDMARRAVRIRIARPSETPWRTTGFRHPNLIAWATEHRGDLIWAALTICRHWFALGQPVPLDCPTLGSFESWTEVMGGILAAAGIDGFLANADELLAASDPGSTAWQQFVEAWAARWPGVPVGVGDLYGIAKDIEGFPLGRQDGERSQKTALGMGIRRRRDAVFGGWKIMASGVAHQASKWRVERVEVPLFEGSPQGSPLKPIDSHSKGEPGEPGEPFSELVRERETTAIAGRTVQARDHVIKEDQLKVPQVPQVPPLVDSQGFGQGNLENRGSPVAQGSPQGSPAQNFDTYEADERAAIQAEAAEASGQKTTTQPDPASPPKSPRRPLPPEIAAQLNKVFGKKRAFPSIACPNCGPGTQVSPYRGPASIGSHLCKACNKAFQFTG